MSQGIVDDRRARDDPGANEQPKRDLTLSAEDSRFDLIVIGGGINGAAIAREAALAGNSVLLLEREDFGSGTSAASTRLIHGGLRYLEHAELPLVRESLAERETLLETAPHLVEPLEILLPLTHNARRGRLQIRLGMVLYDLLSLGKSVPGHRMLDRERLLAEVPGLTPDVVGGAAYFDAQVRYPERLVLENLLDASAAGAEIRNHTAAAGIRVEAGRVRGVTWTAAGSEGVAHAPLVVNAAGPWVDEVLGGSDGRGGPERPGSRGRLASERLIGGTKGSHLITRRFNSAPSQAVYAEAASDGRPFFIIPWNGLYLIGTTDERYTGDPGRAAISAGEARYLIDETRRLFPGADDLEASVLYTYAGIRPLPSADGGDGVAAGAITRRHLIVPHAEADGLYSIVGGKLTTHRALAADCLKRLRRRLPANEKTATASRPLPGALNGDEREALLSDCARLVDEETAERLWRTYGGRTAKLIERLRESKDLRQVLGPGTGCLVGELVFAVEEEWARSLADVLLRRTMTGLEADSGRRAAPLAADWLVRLGVWDKARAADEVAAYGAAARRFAVPDLR